MTTELVEYIRRGGSKKFVNRNGRKKRSKRHGGKRIGLLVGWKARNGLTKVGWSLCHKNDEFDSIEGLIQAKHHAVPRTSVNEDYITQNIPRSIRKKHARFINRTINCFEEENNGVAEVNPA